MRCSPYFTRPRRGPMSARCLNSNLAVDRCTVKSDTSLSPYVGDLLRNIPSRETRWLMQQQKMKKCFCGLLRLQLMCSACIPRRFHDWLSQASCQQSISDAPFASKNNRFTTSLKVNASTIIHAWSRQCEIQQENAHAA